jgi:hypothetical protein
LTYQGIDLVIIEFCPGNPVNGFEGIGWRQRDLFGLDEFIDDRGQFWCVCQ